MISSINNDGRNIQQTASGDKILNISYDNIVPGEYEKRVIFGNMCGALVSMRCIFEGTSADIFYITGGLSRFDEYVKKEAADTQSFLKIILSLLQAVRECRNYLIPENELSLKSENIFFSEMNGNAKLIYMPGFRRESALGEETAALVEKAERICRFGMLQRGIMTEYKAALIEAESDAAAMISLTEEAIRKTFTPAIYGGADYECDSGTVGSTGAEKRQPAVNQASRMMEDASEYGTGGVLKRHIRDFINELVS